MKRHKTVDEFMASTKVWRDELLQLRRIMLATGLTEEVKWGGPCYTHHGKNVVGIGGFKAYFGLWFFQGSLLSDPQSVLINAQEGKTKALRQWRMTSKTDIKPRLIRTYVREAMKLAEKGEQIKSSRGAPVEVPLQLKRALRSNKKAGSGFAALTLGKQREYAEFITDAKREETKLKRVEKILPMIEAKMGLNDKYRNC